MTTAQPSVLIIDDEIGPRESLRILLKPHYQVYTAADGRSALEFVTRQRVDVITLDLKMPGLPGLEVLKAIKGFDPAIEVIIISGWGSFESAVEAIRFGVFDYISKPFNVLDVLNVLKKSVARRETSRIFHQFLKEVLPGEKIPDELIQQARDRIATSQADGNGGDSAQLEFIKVLACTLESRDPYTHGHSGRVTFFSSLLGQKTTLSPAELESIQVASFLHDIGKVGIPDAVINKRGKLSPAEMAIIHEHPDKGIFLIESLNISSDILEIIRHHHERYDGSGYPVGLAAEQIPIGARIVAIADAHDAMSSDRPYRSALPFKAIAREFREGAGTQFDPSLIEPFLNILREGRRVGQSPLCAGTYNR